MKDILQYLDMKATESDLRNGVADEQGVIYSEDGEALLACRNLELSSYSVKKGCKIICNEAFFRFMPFHSKLERISLPEGLLAIGHAAFSACSHLRTVVLPESLRYIGDCAFEHCTIDKISIPAGLLAMGCNPFGVTGLVDVESRSPHFKLIDGCLINDDTMVAWLSDEEVCRVPRGTRKIGEMAFPIMNGIHAIRLPEGLEEIGDYAFQYIGFPRLVIPSTVRKMGKNPFCQAHSLMLDIRSPHFTLDNGLLVSDKGVLVAYMGSRAHVTVPDTVREIGAGAFFNLKRLQSVTLPSELKVIRKRAFAQCENLKELYIPEGVGKIEDGAFDGCSSLRKLTLPQGLGFIGDSLCENSGIEEIVIPDSVTHIGKHAFYLCRSLRSVIIPASVKSIGKNAFFACDSLHDIHIPNKDVRLGEHAFASCHKRFFVSTSARVVNTAE